MKFTMSGCVALCFAFLFSNMAEAAVICVPINCTKVVRDGGNNMPLDGIGDGRGSTNSGTPESGFRAGGENSIAIYVFDLPELNGETITSVSLSTTLGSKTGTPNFNLDAVAFRIDPSNPHVQINDYEASVAALGTSQQIGDDLALPSTAVGATLPTITDGNFLSYLTGSYIENGKLFIAMVPDTLPSDGSDVLLEGSYGVNAPHPLFAGGIGEMVLKITTTGVPEPTTMLLAAMSIGVVLVSRRVKS